MTDALRGLCLLALAAILVAGWQMYRWPMTALVLDTTIACQ